MKSVIVQRNSEKGNKMIKDPGGVILHAGVIKILEYVCCIDRMKQLQESRNIVLIEVF